MKRFSVLFLVAVFTAAMLASCKSDNGGANESGKSVKTGMAVVTSIAKSTDAGENDGLAQADSVVVALTLDAQGKIASCVIDTAQSMVNFDTSGQLITPTNTVFKTKNELGDEYNMKSASGIGKEWHEQAAALANYVQGKTVDEVRNIAVDETNHPTGSDLKSSVTISIGSYIDAIEKAVENAEDQGAKDTDTLKLGIVTNMEKSKSADDQPGLAEIYSTYIAATTDSGGTITSCLIDASQSKIYFDSNGKITTDINEQPKTKNELGDDYGMKISSDIGKEWYEQASAFAEYVKGKTVSEVQSIAVDENEAPTDSDLKASVTIGIADFKAALEKIA